MLGTVNQVVLRTTFGEDDVEVVGPHPVEEQRNTFSVAVEPDVRQSLSNSHPLVDVLRRVVVAGIVNPNHVSFLANDLRYHGVDESVRLSLFVPPLESRLDVTPRVSTFLSIAERSTASSEGAGAPSFGVFVCRDTKVHDLESNSFASLAKLGVLCEQLGHSNRGWWGVYLDYSHSS